MNPAPKGPVQIFTGLNQQKNESSGADSHSSGSMTDKEMNPAPKGPVQIFTGLNQRIIESVPADSHSSGSMTDKEMNPAPKGKIHLFIGLIFVFNNVDVFNKNDCYLFDDYNQLLNIN